MRITEWYFGFHDRASFADLHKGASFQSIFGHVEAFGYTDDQNWLSFDPRGGGALVEVLHRHDDVEEFLASRFEVCAEIWRTEKTAKLLCPLHLPMNCVTQCAALIGLRAFTPKGFRRKLQKIGAEKVHGPQGRSKRKA